MSFDVTIWIILAAAVATYATRIGGYVILARFKRIHPRVEAGLNAVPAAVLSTLVAPALLSGGPAEIAALVAAGTGALRYGMAGALVAGAGLLILLRALTG